VNASTTSGSVVVEDTGTNGATFDETHVVVVNEPASSHLATISAAALRCAVLAPQVDSREGVRPT
jgi:hypothetical protein